MPNDRIVLAYSGGLDTTVAVPWLKEKYGADIVTLTVDLGMVDLDTVRQRALSIGAVEAVIVDGRQALVDEFLYPSLQAGTVYEEQYPLATALGRPLIARYLVEAAREHGAYAVAHGCTGKGNDQVRIEVGVMALDPSLQVIAPIRDWGMSRDDEIEYGLARNLPINTRASRFSTDENLWGRSIEAGELEDPWLEPPEDAYLWTRPVAEAPDEPMYLEVSFDRGVPVAINGESMGGVDLIAHLNAVGGEHGVGRVDHVENRLVGIKSREIYECPRRRHPARGPQGFGDHDPEQGAGPHQGPHRPGILRRHLQRPVVHGPPRRPGRLCTEHPAPCDRRGPAEVAQGGLHRRGPPGRAGAVQLRPRDLRPAGPVRPRRRRRVHRHLRPARQDPEPGTAGLGDGLKGSLPLRGRVRVGVTRR